ncbi:MAG: hypothetical protein L3K17_07620, partial [Thermoplasmata archaeon]|nr:hypothetical protein [Thermoplasmata archaeon]
MIEVAVGVLALLLLSSGLIAGGNVGVAGTVAPPNVPHPVAGHGSSAIVVHHGNDATPERASPASDRLELAKGGGAWTNVTGVIAPHARLGAAMAYDPLADSILLFGGMYGPNGVFSGVNSTMLNDTWLFANGSWTNVTATAGTPPPARAFGSLTYDARDKFMLLAGGEGSSGGCNAPCSDTWRFEGGKWWKLPAATPNARGFSAVYDSSAGFVVGTQWNLNGAGSGAGGGTYGLLNLSSSNWTQLGYNATTNMTSPSPDFWHPALVNDPLEHGILMIGGTDQGSGANAESWLYSGGIWTDLRGAAGGLPPATPYPSAAYDPATRNIVLAQAGGLSETWGFNGSWANESAPTQPPALGAGSLAWDDSLGAAVLFGGARAAHFGSPILIGAGNS